METRPQPSGDKPEDNAHHCAREHDARQLLAQPLVGYEVALAHERRKEQARVEPAAERRRHGNAEVGHQTVGAEQKEQRDRADRVGDQADGRVDHRRLGVLAREIGRREHLDHHEARQPESEDAERVGRCRRVGGGERPALEQAGDDLYRHDGERDGGGQRQKHGELEGAVLAVHHRVVVLQAQMPRHVGQQHHADGDADDGERQLVDAIGVVEVGHRAVLQGRDNRADDDVDLRDAARDDAGHAETDEAAHALRHARTAQLQPDIVAAQTVDQQPQLQDPGGEHAPGLDDAGRGIVL